MFLFHLLISTSIPLIHITKWVGGGGGGNHRTPKTAAAYKECEGASAKWAGRETIPYMATETESNFYQWAERDAKVELSSLSGCHTY